MKKVVTICALSLFCLAGALAACDDGPAQEPTQPAAPAVAKQAPAAPEPAVAAPVAAPAPTRPGPADTCQKLVDAARAGDRSQVLALCMPGSAGVFGKGRAAAGLMKQMAGSECGEATEDAGQAIVTATAGKETRELPFAKIADNWKFDTKAYLEKYSQKHGKRAKKVKPGKRKRMRAGQKTE